MAITREQLISLILVERLTEVEVAQRLGVHKNTVARAKKLYDINPADWWKYQHVHCSNCGKELDPDVTLDAKRRKRLIMNPSPVCNDCKDTVRKEYNTAKQKEWRDNNRDHYNAYMRQWRKDNAQKWKEIKSKSKEKNDD